MKNKLKKVRILAIIAIIPLMFASCSIDSEDIIGTWGCTHSFYEIEDHKYPQHNKTEEDEYYGEIITFNANGSITTSSQRLRMFGIYDGDTWMIDGNNLVVDRNDIWKIKKLNKTTLSIVIERYRQYTADGYRASTQDGENADIVFRYELQFKRQ